MSKSWLVTGGSSGLGLAIGRYVLKQGGAAVLTTRNVQKARDAAPDVEEKGGKWLELNLDSPELEKTVSESIETNNVDVIVNNAGYPIVGAIEVLSPEGIRAQFEANYIAPLRIIQASIPIFRERKAGTIVNIGSSVSYTPLPAVAVYASTKSALRTVTEGLAAEVAHLGIRVLHFEPGRFRTNFGSTSTPVFSDLYKDTPVEMMMSRLASSPPAPGNPDKASVRIWEVVTRTGMGASDKVKDGYLFPLGKDAHGSLGLVAKNATDYSTSREEIATSTDFD